MAFLFFAEGPPVSSSTIHTLQNAGAKSQCATRKKADDELDAKEFEIDSTQ